VIVDSIANLGGWRASTPTAVLYEGDARRWRTPSPSGCRRSSRYRTQTNARFCQRLPSTRRGLSLTISPPKAAAGRCSWAPIRWSPTSAAGSPPFVPACTAAKTRPVKLNVELPSVCLGLAVVTGGRRGSAAKPLVLNDHKAMTRCRRAVNEPTVQTSTVAAAPLTIRLRISRTRVPGGLLMRNKASSDAGHPHC